LDSQIRTSERIIAKLKLAEQGLVNDVFEVRATKWKSFRLSDVTSKITDGTHQAVVTEDDLAESVPFLYVSCVRDGQIDWQSAGRISQSTYADISKGRLPSSGMVLYTAVGSYGHAAVVRKEQSFGFQRHIACIYPNMAKVSGDFIAAFLNSSSGRLQSDRLAVGNAQKTVTLGALGEFEIHVPELPEQQEIVNALSAASGRVAANQRSLAKLHLVKRGLMSDLLTGRVRVPMETAS
jgi:type I restriction enzyme S subunit